MEQICAILASKFHDEKRLRRTRRILRCDPGRSSRINIMGFALPRTNITSWSSPPKRPKEALRISIVSKSCWKAQYRGVHINTIAGPRSRGGSEEIVDSVLAALLQDIFKEARFITISPIS